MPLSTRKFDCMNNTELLRKLQNRMIFLILPKILIANLIRKLDINPHSMHQLIKFNQNEKKYTFKILRRIYFSIIMTIQILFYNYYLNV